MHIRFMTAAFAAFWYTSALLGGTLSLNWATDKEPVSYRPNEIMTFKVQLVDDGQPLAEKTLKWTRTGDDGKTVKGEGKSSATQPVEITTATDKPGFVRLEISVFNADGTPVKDAKGSPLKFEGGAGVEPTKLEGYPEPADFDAFWKAQKAKLAEVPMKATLKEVASKKPGFKVYDVSIACAGGKPVSGYLSVPENAKEKSLGAQVSFHGYGVGGANQESWPGMLVLDINAHGIENGREPEYYKALQDGALKGYGFSATENAKPETAYFSGMMFRLLRALEYVKTRPEWNGKTLIASGGSQGGLQAITAAALDTDVTQCNAYKPWCCDLGGIKLGRLRGWRPDYADGLGYYDTATMGKRIKCPTFITTGLGDYVCPPSGVSVLYNNIKAPKTIEYTQGSTHGYNPPNPKKQTLSNK
ncbi:MAG: acetylxylan esterase [Verrucomicrobiota bacterium]